MPIVIAGYSTTSKPSAVLVSPFVPARGYHLLRGGDGLTTSSIAGPDEWCFRTSPSPRRSAHADDRRGRRPRRVERGAQSVPASSRTMQCGLLQLASHQLRSALWHTYGRQYMAGQSRTNVLCILEGRTKYFLSASCPTWTRLPLAVDLSGKTCFLPRASSVQFVLQWRPSRHQLRLPYPPATTRQSRCCTRFMIGVGSWDPSLTLDPLISMPRSPHSRCLSQLRTST